MITKLDMIGMEDVNANLGFLTREIRDKGLKLAARKAGKPIVDSMKARAPQDTGTYRDAIHMKVTSKGHKGEWVQAIIGLKTGVKVPVRIATRGSNKGQVRVQIPTRYAHLVEFGFNIVREGKIIMRVPPQSVMRGAWDEQGGEDALFRFETTLAKFVDEQVALIPDYRAP